MEPKAVGSLKHSIEPRTTKLRNEQDVWKCAFFGLNLELFPSNKFAISRVATWYVCCKVFKTRLIVTSQKLAPGVWDVLTLETQIDKQSFEFDSRLELLCLGKFCALTKGNSGFT